MPTFRRLTIPIAGLLAAATVAAPSAQADTTSDQPSCPSDDVCLFQHIDFSGEDAGFQVDNLPWPLLYPADLSESAPALHDGVSSWINNSSRAQCVFDTRAGEPPELLWTMPPHSQDAWVGDSVNDRSDLLGNCPPQPPASAGEGGPNRDRYGRDPSLRA
jgi:hypothetical protein